MRPPGMNCGLNFHTNMVPIIICAGLVAFGTDANLESYLTFTTRTQIVGDNKRLAWVERRQGAINLVGSSEGGPSFKLTENVDDAGVSMSNLHITLGGDVVWTQGPVDEANQQSSAVLPTAYTIMTTPFQPFRRGLEPRVLAPHKLVAITPDGLSVLFAISSTGGLTFCEASIAAANISARVSAATVVDTTTCGTGATLLLKVRSGMLGSGGAVWSPDGQTLAMAIHRHDHGFIGLWHRGGERVRWVSPSFDTDLFPTWSASGSKLAFVRFRASSDAHGVAGALHQGPPFSVRVVEFTNHSSVPIARRRRPVAPLDSREIYRDFSAGYPGTGSNGYGGRRMQFYGDSQVLVGTETSGFVHVVALDADGDVAAGTAMARDLTPLHCEVQDWSSLSADGELYVTSNCDNVDALGVMRIDVSSGQRDVVFPGTPTQVGGLSGDESGGAGMLPLDRGRVAFLASTYNLSTAVFIAASGGRPKRISDGEQESAVSSFVAPKLVTFPSSDGLFTIHAQLFEARDPGGARTVSAAPKSASGVPAVIFTHGGSQRQMFGAMHPSDTYAQLFAINQYLAAHGANVLSVNYRSGVGYGRAFRLCEGSIDKCGWQGGAEYRDVQAARNWLEATLSPSAVAIHGLSYGGLNCLQALSRDPSRYVAGACNAPVFNWISTSGHGAPFARAPPTNAGFRNLPVGPQPDLMGPDWAGAIDQNVALAWRSSPSAFVANLTAPLLLLHGDADANVYFQESLGVLRALRRQPGAGARVIESFVLPDETHGFALFENQVRAAEATYDFLARFLPLRARRSLGHV